ncbi:MAG: N-acetylmuramoyl-L-alanine amidase, partial [Pyrinomonadaceae bacterium]|nr:N-acetylmuramoyl-L-alanine amidase [Pyrinomonadaceae bacterium]
MSQRMLEDTTMAYSKIVESYAHFFERPEARLRFLNHTLAQEAVTREKLERRLSRFEFFKKTNLYQRLLEFCFYRLVYDELKKLMPTARNERRQLLLRSNAPLTTQIFFHCYRMRYLTYGVGLVIASITLFGLYTMAVWSTHKVNGYLAKSYEVRVFAGDDPRAGQDQFALTNAGYLPDYQPEKVWLVEQKDDTERYSNAGRILTTYETENRPRSYQVFQHGTGVSDGNVQHQPVGIVYHTSESHLTRFAPDNNESIESHSRGLLEYVRLKKSYNYVIDRFGQIYRIVKDEEAANHAGNSVWADGKGVYVGLNDSFLGVCFETNSKADSLAEQLTEAQLIAGRLLTQILRSRYNLSDTNCVTHGLVSVNPSNMLICFHHDWARNFPFAAMGLSDKYKVAPASVSEFGFTYDEEIMEKLGGDVWSGVKLAEEEFRRRAEELNLTP